jgi:hypothetical protein
VAHLCKLTGVDGIGWLLVTRLTQRNTIDYGRFYNCSPDAVIRLTGRRRGDRRAPLGCHEEAVTNLLLPYARQ